MNAYYHICGILSIHMWQLNATNAEFQNDHICGNLFLGDDRLDTMKRVRELIAARGISLNKLATMCDIKVSTLQMAEARGTQLSVDTIERICKGLEITLVDFFSNEEKDNIVPITIAAHAADPNSPFTPEMEKRLQELVVEVVNNMKDGKYERKDNE